MDSRKVPTKAPGLLHSPHVKKYFRPYFIISRTKYDKNDEHYESKISNKYFIKTVMKVPERPQEDPRTIVMSFYEKYFSHKFHHFCAKYFHHFKISPRSFATFFQLPGHLLCRFKNVLHDLSRKNNYSQNKFATVRKRQIKIEKSRLGPKLIAGGKPSNMFPPGRLVKPCINAKSLFLIRVNQSDEHRVKTIFEAFCIVLDSKSCVSK